MTHEPTDIDDIKLAADNCELSHYSLAQNLREQIRFQAYDKIVNFIRSNSSVADDVSDTDLGKAVVSYIQTYRGMNAGSDKAAQKAGWL
jgi:hypothetical protein